MAVKVAGSIARLKVTAMVVLSRMPLVALSGVTLETVGAPAVEAQWRVTSVTLPARSVARRSAVCAPLATPLMLKLRLRVAGGALQVYGSTLSIR